MHLLSGDMAAVDAVVIYEIIDNRSHLCHHWNSAGDDAFLWVCAEKAKYFSGEINWTLLEDTQNLDRFCKTKYKMSSSSVRSEGGEAAVGYCLNSVSYRVDEAVKYNVLNSD